MIFTYSVVEETFTVPADWIARLEAKCDITNSAMIFNSSSLVECGAIGLYYTAYQGIIYLSKHNKIYTTTKWQRVIAAVILVIPALLPKFIIGSDIVEPY